MEDISGIMLPWHLGDQHPYSVETGNKLLNPPNQPVETSGSLSDEKLDATPEVSQL